MLMRHLYRIMWEDVTDGKKHPVQQLKDQMVEKASLQLKRSHCTLVATIASNEAIQNVLPQVLLPKMLGKKKMGNITGTSSTTPQHPYRVRHQWVDGFENLQKVLGLATERNHTFTSTQGGTCNGLSPQSLLVENTFFDTALEMESFAYS